LSGKVEVIKSFLDKETRELFTKGKCKSFPAKIQPIARRKLFQLDKAKTLNDLKVPPGNKLEALKGNLKGFRSIRINRQYRIIFRFVNGNAYDVAIVDYHK